jgi:hypothetical protein
MNGFAAFLTAAHQRRNPEAIPHRVQDGAGATKRPKFQPGPAWAARYRLDAAAEGRRLGDLLTAACGADSARRSALRAHIIAAMDERISRNDTQAQEGS